MPIKFLVLGRGGVWVSLEGGGWKLPHITIPCLLPSRSSMHIWLGHQKITLAGDGVNVALSLGIYLLIDTKLLE